jgi:hypothetical protein
MAQVYLAIFVIGFMLSLLSFLTGTASHGHGGHFGAPHHGADAGGDGGVPVLNFGTITAFLMWFGGVGFLLTAYSHIVTAVVVGIALLAGLGGGAVVFLFLSKVLVRDQLPMNPADYHLPGTLGRVTVRIPTGGTGEMVYTQGGSRKTAAARDVAGQEIGRGTEVVVLRYERGVAYVRPWDQLSPDHLSERRDGPTVRPEGRPR